MDQTREAGFPTVSRKAISGREQAKEDYGIGSAKDQAVTQEAYESKVVQEGYGKENCCKSSKK
jgi:hypothetical protein